MVQNCSAIFVVFFFFQAEDGIRDLTVTGVQTCALPIYVTAPLVYVNYGVPADYERLERMGVSVKGAIVIARYFGSWRGIKPKVAAEHGAVGCIIYSDPREDGYARGEVYPQGPWRPRDGVQRGSVMDMPLYPGDPLTPGVGATKDAKRLSVSEAPTITKIPVLPISYGDAQPLLAALPASTEWVEAHADERAAKAGAYLNSDTNNRGYLDIGGSHSLEDFINEGARDIEDRETKLTVWNRAQLRAIAAATSADARQE